MHKLIRLTFIHTKFGNKIFEFYKFRNIVLHNEEVWSNTIYSSSEASGLNHIIHLSLRLRWIMICFQRGRNPSRKHAVTLHLWVMYISYQVEMLRERSTDQFTVSHVASSWHDFCANNGMSPVTCLRWRESWLCAQKCKK